MKIRNLFAAFLTLCLTSSALPHGAITQPAVNQIRAGITTEADLTKHFGAPDTKLTNDRGYSSLDWFRSLGPSAGGYVPIVGQFLGGLNTEVQQLSVVLGPNGRVLRYEVHSSKNRLKPAVQTSTTTTTVRETHAPK